MNLSRRSMFSGAAAALLVSPGRAYAGMHRLGGPAFGSYWTALVPDTVADREVRQAVASRVAEGDRLFSPFLMDSELSRFNRLPAGGVAQLSPETRSVIEAAQDCHERTGGAFDPTVGPTVSRVGFGPITGDANASIGLLELESRRAVKPSDGFTLDLCGIAKGWVLDQIVTTLDAMGIEGFLVELGGEVFARGQSTSGRPWRVLIDAPDMTPANFLELRNRAVATSGHRPQSYEIASTQYSHIVDPRRRSPIQNGADGVSVLASTGIEADALATAMMAMDVETALQFAQAQNLDVVLRHEGEAIVVGAPPLKTLE